MLPDNLPITAASPALREFVDAVFLPYLTETYNRDERMNWCNDWALHPTAVMRLAAVHDEWTAVKAADGEISWHAFLHDVLDYHLPLLVNPETGTFRSCKYQHETVIRLDQQTPHS